MGFVSFLCFNTRSSIAMWSILLVIYYVKKVFFDKNVTYLFKIGITTIYVIGLLAMLLLFENGWGDRLTKNIIENDGSAQARFDVWTIFNYYDLPLIFYGESQVKIG